MKTIYNKISNIINSILEKVGYHFVGYKVEIEQNQYDIKAIRQYKIGLHEFKEFKKEVESNLVELKKVIDVRINMLEKDFNQYTELDTHYEDSVNLNDIKNELTKPSKNIDDNILTLENIINSIIEVKVNNACKIALYGVEITLEKEPYDRYVLREIISHYVKNDNNIKSSKPKASWGAKFKFGDEILEEIAKILVPYDNDGINLNIDDVVDDINDVFNGFTNTYNDVCDDNNNINLGN